MGYRQTAPDKHSISSLLNPVATPQSDPSHPPNFRPRADIPRRSSEVSNSNLFEHPGSPSSGRRLYPAYSGLPPQTTDSHGTVRENLSPSRAFNPGDPPNTASSSPIPSRHGGHHINQAGGQFRDYESYVNGVYNSTAYDSSINGSRFRNEASSGSAQSTQVFPRNPNFEATGNSVTQNPGGTYHTFSLELQREYSPTSSSPLFIKPRTGKPQPQPKVCSSCGVTHTILWRKSKVNPGNYLCNRCGLWERNNRVERGILAENRTSTVKEFIVQSPYSYEGGDVE
ncbi:hypothetical protein F5878DRAFT_601079 [Lentinula raphanica]|uniref:GATA-type domain-containing protein n=1 Tax=Lentinula raphanica TaxID=153919 RepID=A0AA38PKR7_9AGAR|nr:hypothetical protein F5880DRAFT_143129 [Lentinula raphanica]KAJ3844745.1 hypothetical protein F5878DRAFT_601079 [Lentinula raphanica]